MAARRKFMRKGFFNVGDMVPYATSTFHPRVGSAGPPPAVQYIDLDTGVNIDCRLRELSGKMMLNAQLDISAIRQHDKAAALNPPNATVAAARLGISALMSPDKPTQIVSMDDPSR